MPLAALPEPKLRQDADCSLNYAEKSFMTLVTGGSQLGSYHLARYPRTKFYRA
jgi:hypothetical protein